MRALILTCNTGEGHNSVAAAVKQVFEGHGASCLVVDALSFLSERASEVIGKLHTRMYRYVPGAWRVGYKFMENHTAVTDEDSLIVQFLSSGAERLRELLLTEGFDHIICPHVFAGLMVTRMRRLWPEQRATASFIATDYTCSPMVNDCRMDWFFVPSQDAVASFTAMGVPAERIAVTSGVPVRRGFYERTDKREARRRLGLPEEGNMILAMCGSMGCGPLEELTELLAGQIGRAGSMCVVCGTNVHLQKRLERNFGGGSVHVLGYTDEMPLLMDAADLYLTKPGGLSTSEAAVKGLPMVLVDAVAGCEEDNLRHFCALGGAVTAERTEQLAALCIRLLADGESRARMSRALLQRGDAGQEIYARLTEKAV